MKRHRVRSRCRERRACPGLMPGPHLPSARLSPSITFSHCVSLIVPLWSLFRDDSAVTFNQEETGVGAITFPYCRFCFMRAGSHDDHKVASVSETPPTRFEFR